MMPPPTSSSLDVFLSRYEADDNVWWAEPVGALQNYFDDLLERYRALQRYRRAAEGLPPDQGS